MIASFPANILFGAKLPYDIALIFPIGILLLTVFLGFFIVFLGLRKRHILKGYLRIPAVIEDISYPSFAATIAWSYMGITHYVAGWGIHAITKKDKLWVRHNPKKYETVFDIWTHNGKGLILSGALISFLTGLALYLLVVLS